jgi:hypothetical protein
MIYPDLKFRTKKPVPSLTNVVTMGVASPKSIADLFGLAPPRIKVTFRGTRIECGTAAEAQAIIEKLLEHNE